jgi:long-chain fatty acid transport protein
MRRFAVSVTLGLAAALAVMPRAAAAQGFGFYEQSACATGRAGTGVASPCADASSIFYNPAGLANTPARLSIGATGVLTNGGFENRLTGLRTDLNDNLYPVPNLYISKPFGGRYAAGIGVYAPYGLTTEWPTSFEGRNLGYRTSLRAVYVQPTVAAKFGRISVGAGVDIGTMSVRLRQRLDLASVPASGAITFGQLGVAAGTDFADVDIRASKAAPGYHLGVQLQPIDRLTVGARYLSRHRFEFEGGEARVQQVRTGLLLAPGNPLGAPAGTPIDAIVAPQFAPGGRLTDQTAATIIRLPEQFVVGAAVRPIDRLTVLFDVQFTNWSVFDQVDVVLGNLGTTSLYEGYQDTETYRVGGEYALSERATLRAGYYTHGAAAPPETVTPNLPEAARSSFTAGLGARISENLSLDLAYQYLHQSDRQGRTTSGGVVRPTTAVNSGLYDFNAHLIGATFAFAF